MDTTTMNRRTTDFTIHVRAIPHFEQRYPTAGDWIIRPDNSIEVRVTRMSRHGRTQLLIIHEVVEALLCIFSGVSGSTIDDFDMAWAGPGEPGDNLSAPYHHQHAIASVTERLAAQLLKVDWNTYNTTVENL